MSTLRATNIKGRNNGVAPAMPDGVVVTGVVTATTGDFSGNVTVSGTLNYEDVTNIDSIGIITARSNVSIADSIIHTGDTDTSIRFPSAGTFTVSTNGSERLRVDSDGHVLTSNFDTSSASGGGSKLWQTGSFHVQLPSTLSSSYLIRGYSGTTETFNVYNDGSALFKGNITIPDKIIHDGDTNTSLRFPADDTVTVETAGSERLRIASDGDIRVGSAFSVGQAGVVTCSTVEARVPQIPQNAQASTYTLVKADAGKHINAGGNVTVNSGIFAIGDCISIFNDTTGNITIIQGSSVTLRLVADTGTGTRTLANYGLAAVLCVGSNEFVVSGGGVS